MARYSAAMYTDGPATHWNVIDSQTQEWVRRFATKEEADQYADKLNRNVTITLQGRDSMCSDDPQRPQLDLEAWKQLVKSAAKNGRKASLIYAANIANKYRPNSVAKAIADEIMAAIESQESS